VTSEAGVLPKQVEALAMEEHPGFTLGQLGAQMQLGLFCTFNPRYLSEVPVYEP
jgi:hypothetical protein